jgi:hypothetical protein
VVLALVTSLGAGGSGGAGPAQALVVQRAMAVGSTVYAGGVYRNPDNAAGNKLLGHQMLAVLDASDPAALRLAAESDMKLTQVFAVWNGKLLAVQHGTDEATIDGTGVPTPQNLRLKIFGLTDPSRPALERTIEIPGGANSSPTAAVMLDGESALVSVGAGTEGSEIALTWVVRPGGGPGEEIAGSANAPCRVPVRDGDRVWCFGGLGRGTGLVVGLALAAGGGLTEIARVPVAELVNPVGAALVAAGGSVVVTDLSAGTLRLDRDSAGVPAVVSAAADLPGPERSALAGGAGLVVQTETAIHVVDAATLASGANLPYPGEPYQSFAGGASLARLSAAAGAGASLDGLVAAALGDYGVLLVRETGGTLETVGGYWRHFGTDFIHEDNLRVGGY